jgi:DNA-binding NarL/FixJ family response regulator
MRPPRVLLGNGCRHGAEDLSACVAKAFELVGTAGDGAALLEAAMTLRPDVVVADLSMAAIDGLTAMKEIHQRLPYTRVILLTSDGDASTARHALSAGAAGFIMKADAPAELVDAIRRVADGETFVSGAIAMRQAVRLLRQTDR